MKNRIYLKQWLEIKPYDNQTSTDIFYLKLCNEVKQSIISKKQVFFFQKYLGNDETDQLCCFLTSYFEDLISGTNLWNSFIRIHKRMYGKQLPFYDTNEYYKQEINLADICFLIWYFLNTIQQDKFILPNNDFLLETATDVMDVFEDEWEYAPENRLLKAFYSIDETDTDFYKARKLIDNILFKSYLFYPDSQRELLDNESKIFEKNKNNKNLLSFLNENRDNMIFNTYTRLLGLKGQEWVAEILGDEHNLSKDYLKISKKITGYFFYKGQDQENVFIEHIASEKKFNITKKSFDHYAMLIEIDTIIFMGIVEWRNEWWFSGVYFQTEFNADLVLDEKNSLQSRSEVSFLDFKNRDMDFILGEQLNAFLKFNNNQQIAFMDANEINSFIEDYFDFHTKFLNLTQNEKFNAIQRARNKGLFGNNHKTIDFSKKAESGLVFFNPKKGIEIALSFNSAFPMQNNPYFKEEESNDQIIQLIFAEEISRELVLFCIDNLNKDSEFFKTTEAKLLLDNIDFFLRFWKRDNYFSTPSISFTGEDN